jgi:hypothetical protein
MRSVVSHFNGGMRQDEWVVVIGEVMFKGENILGRIRVELSGGRGMGRVMHFANCVPDPGERGGSFK